jgi:hypothetical protein
MTDFVDLTVREIDIRITAVQDELSTLEQARTALVGGARFPRRPCGKRRSERS